MSSALLVVVALAPIGAYLIVVAVQRINYPYELL